VGNPVGRRSAVRPGRRVHGLLTFPSTEFQRGQRTDGSWPHVHVLSDYMLAYDAPLP